LSERVSKVEVEDSAVDTGKVGSARGLVFFGVKGEGVDVDTISRGSGVVVAGLVVVEVRTFLNFKAIMTVKLNVGRVDGVTHTVESETVVVRLSYNNIFVDTVFSGVSGSVVDSEVFNRDR